MLFRAFDRSVLLFLLLSCVLVSCELSTGDSDNLDDTSTIDSTAPIATVSPNPGVYNHGVQIQISSNESGVIYYSFNSDDPKTSFILYSGPVTVNTTATLRYFARDLAGNESIVQSASYTVDQTAPMTSASPAGGTFQDYLTVNLSVNESATTYFSKSPSDPLSAFIVYTAPIQITADTTLRFYSIDAVGNQEGVRQEVYNIRPATPSMPTNIVAETSELGKITLSWNPGRFYDSYNIFYSIGGPSVQPPPSCSSGAGITSLYLVSNPLVIQTTSSDTYFAFRICAHYFPADIDEVSLAYTAHTPQIFTILDSVPRTLDSRWGAQVEFHDMNGDGLKDLIEGGWSNLEGQGTMRMRNQDGTFGSATSIGSGYTGGGTTDFAVADINNDGFLDIAFGVVQGLVSFGNGDGTMRITNSGSPTAHLNLSPGLYYDQNRCKFGRLNSDNFTDSVCVLGDRLYFNYGPVTNTQYNYISWANQENIMLPIYLDGEVHLELFSKANVPHIIVQSVQGYSLDAVVARRVSNQWTLSQITNTALTGVRDFLVEDMTGDGKVDLVLARNPLTLLPGQDTGAIFGAPIQSPSAASGIDFTSAPVDLNGDGFKELFMETGVLFAKASFDFHLPVSLPMSSSSMTTFDYDGDSIPEAVTLTGDIRFLKVDLP